MSNDLRKNVLDFLQNLPENPSDQFNQLFEFYKKNPRKQKALEISYNRKGYSDQGLKNLIYDVKKVYEITDLEVLTKKEVSESDHKFKIETIPDYVLDFTEEQLRSWAKSEVTTLGDGLQEVIILAEKEGFNEIVTILTEELNNLKNPEKNKEIVVNGEKLQENDVEPLRTEFPFLNDPKCPDKLFIVVGRRISSYKVYKELHERLLKVESGEEKVSEEEKLELVKNCDEAFNENKALWDELNYYKENSKILGKHPLFREDNIKKEVDKMTTEEMFKLKQSSPKYFHDQNKALEKWAKDPVKLEAVNQKISDRKFKLSLVDAKIGANAKE